MMGPRDMVSPRRRLVRAGLIAASVSMLAPLALAAQRPTTRDTSALRRAPDGLVLDFVQQDVAVVLRAIAEAGGLSISLSNMPEARVTLRLQTPLTRDAALDALRAVAVGHDIDVQVGPSMIGLVGPARVAPGARSSERTLNLYTLRLKHTTAAAIAPMLMNVLTGTGSIGGAMRGSASPIGRIQGVQRGGVTPATPADASAPGGAAPAGVGAEPLVMRDAMGGILGQQVSTIANGASFSDIRIVPDDATNSLIVRATAEDYQAVQQLVQTLDLRPLQVLIEVTIAQVERSGDLTFGVSGTAANRGGTAARDTVGRLPGVGTSRDFVALLTGGRGTVDFNLAINALQTRGNVRLLALPVLIAQNNKEAVLNVGSSVPFVQVSQQGGFDPRALVQTVQYLPVGKQLTITPTINADGYVNMDVVQTNDDVTSNLLFNAPIINQRQAQTSVFVRNGQTTVIGGLSDNTEDVSRTGIPFLSSLPFVGGLFGNTKRSTRTTELFLFLTPHIVSSDEDIDRLREQVRSGTPLLRNVPVEGRLGPKADTTKVRRDSVRTPGA